MSVPIKYCSVFLKFSGTSFPLNKTHKFYKFYKYFQIECQILNAKFGSRKIFNRISIDHFLKNCFNNFSITLIKYLWFVICSIFYHSISVWKIIKVTSQLHKKQKSVTFQIVLIVYIEKWKRKILLWIWTWKEPNKVFFFLTIVKTYLTIIFQI